MNNTHETLKTTADSPGLSWSGYVEEHFMGNDGILTTPRPLAKLMPGFFRRIETPLSSNRSSSRKLFSAGNAEGANRAPERQPPQVADGVRQRISADGVSANAASWHGWSM